MSFHQRLLAETEAERNKFMAIPLLHAGVRGEVSHDLYIAFLTQAYHHVKHTVPLLMACGARIPERLEWLRAAVAHYIEEETGHQEWILNDIRHCGGDSEAVRHGSPSMETDIMVAYAYDTVMRRNPVGLFGMVLVLEGTSVNIATRAANAIQQRIGLPDNCFTYLASHGSLDINHMEFFEKLVNRLAEPTDQAAVIGCAKVMYRLYGDIFRALSTARRAAA